MRLTDHDLKQINREYLASLSPEQLLRSSGKILDDLRDARDRLNRTPQNSSRPSGSYAPWEQAGFTDERNRSEDAGNGDETEEKEKQEQESKAKQSEGQLDDTQTNSESLDFAHFVIIVK